MDKNGGNYYKRIGWNAFIGFIALLLALIATIRAAPSVTGHLYGPIILFECLMLALIGYVAIDSLWRTSHLEVTMLPGSRIGHGENKGKSFTPEELAGLKTRVLELVNKSRTATGLQPLTELRAGATSGKDSVLSLSIGFARSHGDSVDFLSEKAARQTAKAWQEPHSFESVQTPRDLELFGDLLERGWYPELINGSLQAQVSKKRHENFLQEAARRGFSEKFLAEMEKRFAEEDQLPNPRTQQTSR